MELLGYDGDPNSQKIEAQTQHNPSEKPHTPVNPYKVYVEPVSEMMRTSLFESMTFESKLGQLSAMMSKRKINKLSKLQMNLFNAIKQEDADMFIGLGGHTEIDLNYQVWVDEDTKYYPIQMAVAKGNPEIMEAILENTKTDIEKCDERTGVNAFWLSAYFGRGDLMVLLAQAGINIFNTHLESHNNALHIATERRYPEIVTQLINSGFPLDDRKKFGFSALHIAAGNKDNESIQIVKLLVNAKADMNAISSNGSSPLSEAVKNENHKIITFLLKRNAQVYYDDIEILDKCPMFMAVKTSSIPIVEMFCDHGTKLDKAFLATKNQMGYTPMLFAIQNDYHNVVMYLALRCQNIDLEDKQGYTALTMYVLKEDIARCKQMIMRGSKINYVNKFGKTALYIAIEHNISEEMILFLIDAGAQIHVEDQNGKDCCDVAV